jgi:hypothetical protein
MTTLVLDDFDPTAIFNVRKHVLPIPDLPMNDNPMPCKDRAPSLELTRRDDLATCRATLFSGGN